MREMWGKLQMLRRCSMECSREMLVGIYQKSFDIFREMNGEGVNFDAFIVPILLKAGRNLLGHGLGR